MLEEITKNIIRIILTISFVSLLIGCLGGGGGGDSDSSGTAPSISIFTIMESAIYINDSSDPITVFGTFNFTDPDGNLRTTTITVLDASGNTVLTETIDSAAASGLTTGTLTGSVVITTPSPGDFKVQVYVTDTSGLVSNTLESDFRMREFPWVAKKAMPTPRSEFSTATVNGMIYVIGGRDALYPGLPKPVVTTVEVYDPATDSWSTGPSLLVAASNQMTTAVNGKIYTIGGEAGFSSTDVTNVTQEFDPATQKWSLKTNMPDYRSSASISDLNNRVYIAGGRIGIGVTDSLLWYEPAVDTWGAGSPMSESREGSGGATIDAQVLIFGGDSGSIVMGTLESYDPLMDIWSFKASDFQRIYFGTAVYNNLMYVIGGLGHIGEDSVRAYDYSTDSWLHKTSMPSGLRYARSEIIGDKIYTFGTYETFEYTPSDELW